MRFGIAALDSKWKEIPTLEEFAELTAGEETWHIHDKQALLVFFVVFRMIATHFHLLI